MMKRFHFTVLCFLVVLASLAQDSVLSPEVMIKDALRTGGLDGHVIKYFRRSGDAGAVTLVRVLGDKTPTDSEIDDILIFVEGAFSDLQQVESGSDREPRVTLLLLKYLDYATHTPALKSRIADTRKDVLSAFAKLAENRQGR
jgi:hypothetical protein